MKIIIGIPAYNEEKNIEKLLNILIEDCLNDVESIYVISSGSKDKTNEIVSYYHKICFKIKLINESNRDGKSSAVNKLLDILDKNYDALICMGADNLPEKGTIRNLINYLKKDDIAIVGGRPTPVNSTKDLLGFFAHLLWNLHHLTSLQHPKISGELMAFKKGVVRKIPPQIINDDLYLQSVFELEKYNLMYCQDARVYLKGPETISDFIKQRRRIFIGHKQIESLLGMKAPTMRWPSWSLIIKGCPNKGLKGYIYAILFIFIQGVAFLLSLWDFYRGKIPYKWDIAETSKIL